MTEVATTGTEERLFDCALTLFAEKGYAATSVREIIEAVGLAKPVLYYYCKNKVDLFSKLVDRIHHSAYRELELLCASPLPWEEKLRQIIRGTFAFCRADPRVPRLMAQASFGPSLPELSPVLERYESKRFEMICEVIKQGRTGGGEAVVAARAMAFCSLMDHPVIAFTRSEGLAVHLTEELADSLCEVFLSGVS